ncbi:MAG: Uma2 family endonuclease [Candidatus Eremiobacteraeota bacterium]|nr:Uma2 family endonuclease [Candidatus Eremiobacteraeota bacterium]
MTIPDGTPHRIDFATFVRLGELGIYPTRSELVDGIVYDRSPESDPHYLAQAEIVEQLVDARAGRYRAGTEPTLRIDDRNGPMPDVLVTPRNPAVSAASADLVFEVADSSLAYDRTAKRARYARAGVKEYWVVDLRHELVERYLPAGADAPTILQAGDELSPAAYPDVLLDLAAVFAAARAGRSDGANGSERGTG